MTRAHQALYAARQLRHQFVGPDGYGLTYGSHPAGTATATSDLDLVLVGPRPLTPDRLGDLVDAVCQLHHEHGLALDTEVDYAVKVFVTCDDVTDAVSLRCFPAAEDGRIDVSPVVVEPWFLNSDTFRLRLLLNALTSPHSFLGGNVTLYNEHRRRAERALALLALSLHNDTTVALADAIAVVIEHAEGARGKDFLGYVPGPHLESVLHRGLARLRDEGIVRDVGGSRFECEPAALQAALARLRGQPVAEREPTGAPGTMNLCSLEHKRECRVCREEGCP